MSLASAIDTDALVVGAGPVGLFMAFQLGLMALRTQLVDALPHAGGQCTELYPDKPIYDIPGLPVVSGADLSARLLQQIAPFGHGLHLGQQVSSLQAQPDGRWRLHTDQGQAFTTRSVFIAAGAGAFLPRRPSLAELDAHLAPHGAQHPPADAGTAHPAALAAPQVLFQRPAAPEALAGKQVLILGDEAPALDDAIALATAPAHLRPARLTVLHRRAQFRADAATVARFEALRAEGALHFVAGQPSALLGPDGQAAAPGQVHALAVLPPEGDTLHLPMDHLLVRLGLSPRLGPVADWGLALHRKQLAVDTCRFETSVPGIYAVGDINTYPGKRKLLVCGFHEATMAAYAAAEHLRGAPVLLQYTTTSPRLQQLLGVARPLGE